MLDSLLPTILPRLFTTSPTPSSQQSIASQTSVPPPTSVLSDLGIMLSNDVTHRIKTQLDNIYGHTLSHAEHLRKKADVEFLDTVDSLDRAADSKMQQFTDELDELTEFMQEKMEHKGHKVCDDVKASRDVLRMENGWLLWRREVLRRDETKSKDAKVKTSQECNKQRGRAGSAPV